MKACVQRVSSAAVHVDGNIVGQIEHGLLVLLGVAQGDATEDADRLARKIVELRIFNDEAGQMNRALLDVGGAVLVVSQFTLLGDCRKGRRPSFVDAAAPEVAEALYERFAAAVEQLGARISKGKFRAHMKVHLVNDGPVTLLLDTRNA